MTKIATISVTRQSKLKRFRITERKDGVLGEEHLVSYSKKELVPIFIDSISSSLVAEGLDPSLNKLAVTMAYPGTLIHLTREVVRKHR